MNIVGMLSRMLFRRAANWGVRRGSDALARRGAGTAAAGKMTPAAKKQAQDHRKNVKRARMAAKVARRLMR